MTGALLWPPQKATLDSMRTLSWSVSYRHLSPQFQFSLSAVTLGIYLGGGKSADYVRLPTQFLLPPPSPIVPVTVSLVSGYDFCPDCYALRFFSMGNLLKTVKKSKDHSSFKGSVTKIWELLIAFIVNSIKGLCHEMNNFLEVLKVK